MYPHSFVVSSFVSNSYPCFVEDFFKFVLLSLLNLGKKNNQYAKSIVCHQFNFVKDKHNIFIILVSFMWFPSFFRSYSWYQFSSLSCSSFIFHSSKFFFLKYLFAKFHLNLSKFIILFFSSFISFDHYFVYGGSSWWFVKDFVHSQGVLQHSCWGISCILYRALQSVIISPLAFDMVL